MEKTHVIDGLTYVEVKRSAKIGEKIIIVSGSGWYRNEVGSVFKVIDGADYGFERFPDCERSAIYVEHEDNRHDESINFVSFGNYRVLEPLVNEASLSITDLLANLARRVHSLEQQLRDTQGNVEKLAEELANVKYLAGSNEQDIVMLDERTQPQSVEVVTFEKFLDSVTEDVAKKLAEKVSSDLRTEMRLKALRGF
jgi:hypothetical protein